MASCLKKLKGHIAFDLFVSPYVRYTYFVGRLTKSDNNLETWYRPLVKSGYRKINFLISQPKHTVLLSPKKYVKTDGLEKIHSFPLKNFVYLNLCWKGWHKILPLSF